MNDPAVPMTETELAQRIQDIGKATYEKQKELAALMEQRRQLPPQAVDDFVLTTPDGDVKLSELFGAKSDLIVVHNMGSSCPYCTLWADGLIGLVPHLEDRAAFVVVSPDSPETQRAFAKGRGWPFRMASGANSGFTAAMGFESEEDGKTSLMPGYSTFHKGDDGSIVRIAHDFFGPGDLYCGLWHMFGILKDGSNGWHPKFSY
jgi:predicted dithiol-disulfide oxidoreductase (DUF899 family)